MMFSDMKLQAMNAVKSYFKRNWTRQDMMNSGRIPLRAHRSLEMVYFTLFNAMFCSTLGSYLHLFWEAGGLFTVLSSAASLLCLCFTSPQRERTRVLLLMIAAFCFGASVGIFTKYLFKIDQLERLIAGWCILVIPLTLIFIRSMRNPNWKNFLVANLLAVTTFGTVTFSFGASITRERSDIYLGCLLYSCVLMFSGSVFTSFYIVDSHTTHLMLMVFAVQTLFMGYLVIYSQEIVYNALSEDVNFVNCTLAIFFHLPGIVVHAARLHLGAEIEQRRRHNISYGVRRINGE